MRTGRNPVRLVVSLSVAALLAVFLLYTSLAGGAARLLRPSQLRGHPGTVMVEGLVLAPVDPVGDGLRFGLRDVGGAATVPVRYQGAVPDLFAPGRHVFLTGTMRRGVFVGAPGSLLTKCPSKYTSAPET